MPRPTLEKPIPAMYWPSAMPSLPSGVLATAPRRFFEMISMAFKWNISLIAHAPLVM